MTSSFFQSELFGKLQEQIPGRGKYWLVDGILVIKQRLSKGKCWLWIPYATNPRNAGSTAKGQLFARRSPAVRGEGGSTINKIAKEENAVFCRIEPSVIAESPAFGWRRGLLRPPRRARNDVADRYTPQRTLILDLDQSEDALLNQMKPKGRYNIKVAQKHGVTVKQINAFNFKDHKKDFDAWYTILQKTGARDEFGIHSKGVYEHLLKIFGEKAVLFIAYKNKTILGGIIVIFYGDTATYYYGASDHAHRADMAPYLLQWEAIHEAKHRGMRHYDFLGIAPSGSKNHPWAGVTEFKKKFGGREVSYQDATVIVYQRWWYFLYRFAKIIKALF